MSTPLPTQLPTQLPTHSAYPLSRNGFNGIVEREAPHNTALKYKFQLSNAYARAKQRYSLGLPSLLRLCLGSALLTVIPLVGTAAFAQTAGKTDTSISYAMVKAPQRLAQQVIDGLPPPPPIPDLQIPDGAERPTGGGLGSGVQSQEASGELYMVYVNGDSPLLLEQVQQVEPTARVQPYEGQQVILVGLFDGARTANEQVAKLGERGIEANVLSVSSVVLSPSSDRTATLNPSAPIPSEPVSLTDLPPADPEATVNRISSSARPSVSVAPPAISSPSGTPTVVTNAPRKDNAYYVVIPGDEEELGELWQQVVLLGAAPNAVEQRDRPLGHHLLVGPFVDQDAATRWNRYFQDFGMDARVYYKR